MVVIGEFYCIRTDFNFIFGQFSVARKLILNGGAIRPTGLLFIFHFTIFHGIILRSAVDELNMTDVEFHFMLTIMMTTDADANTNLRYP